jgi:hypothetical protein
VDLVSTLQIAVYGDGVLFAGPETVNYAPGQATWVLVDRERSMNHWQIDYHSDTVKVLTGWQSGLLCLRWNHNQCGPVTPTICYLAVTDCPSVSWIPNWIPPNPDTGWKPPAAWTVTMRVIAE